MSLKQYLIAMLGTTIIAYVVLLNVIYYFDPFVAGTVALVLFYISLFLSALGTFSLLGFVIRYMLSPKKIAFREVVTSFRQGIWLSLVIVISLILKSLGLFNFVSVVLLIAALTILETIFLGMSQKSRL